MGAFASSDRSATFARSQQLKTLKEQWKKLKMTRELDDKVFETRQKVTKEIEKHKGWFSCCSSKKANWKQIQNELKGLDNELDNYSYFHDHHNEKFFGGFE